MRIALLAAVLGTIGIFQFASGISITRPSAPMTNTAVSVIATTDADTGGPPPEWVCIGRVEGSDARLQRLADSLERAGIPVVIQGRAGYGVFVAPGQAERAKEQLQKLRYEPANAAP